MASLKGQCGLPAKAGSSWAFAETGFPPGQAISETPTMIEGPTGGPVSDWIKEPVMRWGYR